MVLIINDSISPINGKLSFCLESDIDQGVQRWISPWRSTIRVNTHPLNLIETLYRQTGNRELYDTMLVDYIESGEIILRAAHGHYIIGEKEIGYVEGSRVSEGPS